MSYSSSSLRKKNPTGESRKYFGASVVNNSMNYDKEFEDIENKMDVILGVNEQLRKSNNELHLRVEDLQRECMANKKFSNNCEEVYRLKRQLELKTLEVNDMTKKNIIEKENITDQLEQLNLIIKNLTKSHENLTMDKDLLERKLDNFQYEKDRQINSIREEFQNQIYQNSLKKELEHKEEIRDKQKQLLKELQTREKQWEDKAKEMQENKINVLLKMEEKYEQEKEEVRKTLQQHFSTELKKLQHAADTKCRQIKDKSEEYIKTMLEERQNETEGVESLKEEIQFLKNSLEARKKVIDSMLLEGVAHFSTENYFQQVQDLRQRIKSLTESFFKQSELLKVKMTLKHEADVKEVAATYNDRIDVLGERITALECQNKRLREKYEEQIRLKLKQRQKFEIDTSKLKNIIRKMKIELESYGKQLRLNIQGMKSQANSFSMSILTELGQQKNKKNFYEEEIRKMREVVDLKEQQMETMIVQCNKKIQYYEQKIQSLKQNIGEKKKEIEEKEEILMSELETYKIHAKTELDKQNSHWMNIKQDLDRQICDLKAENQSSSSLNIKLEASVKRLEADVRDKEKQIDSAKAHIDAMRLEMEMIEQGHTSEEAFGPFKKHYERIIEELQQDKANLQSNNSSLSEQMAQLISKYKSLEHSLQKTLSTMKKRSELEQKVVELGMDENLVKNLGEIFSKEDENKENK